MTLFRPATFGALAAAIMTGISIYALTAFPDLPARLPMTIAGHPFTDRHAALILFVFPLVAALLAAAFALIAAVPLLRSGLERSTFPYVVIGHGLVLMVLALQLILITGAAGFPVDIARAASSHPARCSSLSATICRRFATISSSAFARHGRWPMSASGIERTA